MEYNLMCSRQYQRSVYALLVLLVLSGCASSAGSLLRDEKLINISTGTDQRISVSGITSYQARHDENIFMQQEDYSCGAASIATLMTYYFDHRVSEKDVLDNVEQLMSKEEFAVVEGQGLSMLELGTVAEFYGYESASVQLTLDSLDELKSPIIVFIELDGYQHFAVLKGVADGFAYLADPSRGNIEFSIDAFAKTWSGKAFFMGKSTFTPPATHALSIDKGRPASMARAVMESELFKVPLQVFPVNTSNEVAR